MSNDAQAVNSPVKKPTLLRHFSSSSLQQLLIFGTWIVLLIGFHR